MPIELTIDGRSSNDYDDEALIALNQELGRRVDAIQLQRKMINAALAQRRARAQALTALSSAGVRPDNAAKIATAIADVKGERVDAVAPGALIIATAGVG